MWRYPMVLLVVAVSLGAAELVERHVGDEDLEWWVAVLISMFGIASLWPVYFGLRAAPAEDDAHDPEPAAPERTAGVSGAHR